MSYFESFILGLIQGITEFLPISSSGHLLMFRSMFNIDNFDLLIEVSLHLGTLLAIFIYWKDFYLKEIDKFMDGDRKMFFNVLIGSLPAGIVGLLYKNQIKEYFFDIGSISYLVPIYFIMAIQVKRIIYHRVLLLLKLILTEKALLLLLNVRLDIKAQH